NCDVNLQVEVQCVNGDISILGPTRAGSVIDQIGSCPIPPPNPTPTPTPTPAACGDHTDGSFWFEDTTSTTVAQCNTCPDGSPQYCIYTVQTQKECSNGNVFNTGFTQKGAVQGYQNECLPPPPKACGDEASGATWWINAGTQ